MYRVLKQVAPEGTETIKWGIPIFWNGRVLFGFAAYKAHISFGPGPAAIAAFSKEIADYETGKGTMRIPYDQPVPEELVGRIAAFCVTRAREDSI